MRRTAINFIKISFLSVIIGLVVCFIKNIIVIDIFTHLISLLLKIIILFVTSLIIYLFGLKVMKIDAAKKILNIFMNKRG